MSSLKLWLALGIAAATACLEPVSTVDYAARVLTPEAWSEGELLVASDAFRESSRRATILLDSTALPLRRVDDTTMAAQLPITSGVHTLTIMGDRIQPTATVVRVYGFHSVREGPSVSGYALPFTRAGATAFLANGERSLMLADARFGTAQALPASIHSPWCMRGPGPTYRPDRVVLRTGADFVSCGGSKAWSLTGTPQLFDSTSLSTWRLAAQLGPNTWLASYHHQICTVGPGNPGQCQTLEETNAVRISPRGDVATPLIHYAFNTGVPVYDATSGVPRYYVGELRSSGGAAFNSSGDTLFLVGEDATASAATTRILALEPLTGTRLAEASFAPVGYLYDLALLGPWLVLAAAEPSLISRPLVIILDRDSLTVTATLRAPATVTCWTIFCGELQIVADLSAAYLLETSGFDYSLPFGFRSFIYRFEVPRSRLSPSP